ncbi:MAG: nucleotide exchange factor GrpE [Lamprobacter sp.]|uniref:nucleotide exchange factor GrpE n=1 Tax=Lamprobacter sp. TaxID=3100796 RepID=UPI002B25FD38|nr:nucleotide exchange factor GrpE [Lamprobacter sp.]MEA3639232.1 nucleotide exchange factor GrpE [Lamprobacter sp.]
MTKEYEEQQPGAPGQTQGSESVSLSYDVDVHIDADLNDATEDSDAFDDTEASTSAQDPAELSMLLEDARAKADEAHNQALRLRAEMENMSRRQAKELENAHKFALEGFVKELLQVRDSLELGQAAAAAPDADVSKLREGTELTLKLLRDVMTKFGVERIDPEGEPFNPEYHQAMSMQPRSDVPPNTVVNVVQSGYLLNGRLVRPALVMVSQAA